MKNYKKLLIPVLPVTVLTGCAFILCVLVFRRGIIGEISVMLLNRANKKTESSNTSIMGISPVKIPIKVGKY